MSRRTKAEVQAQAAGVVISWLRQECHLDDATSECEIRWAIEAQKKIADLAERERARLLAYSRRPLGPRYVARPLASKAGVVMPRHPRVPLATKADQPWLGRGRAVRQVLGVVTDSGKIELVWVRHCDPTRALNTFFYWPEAARRWAWDADGLISSPDIAPLTEELRRRIRTAVHRALHPKRTARNPNSS